MGKDAQVVVQLLHGAHTAEDGDHLGHIIQVTESPFHGGTLLREGFVQRSGFFRRVGQRAAA